MKTKVILPILSFSLLMLIVLASCQEGDDLSVQQQALMNKALAEMQTAYDNAKSHHDSLIMYQHDALMMQDSLHFKAMVQHCDDVFHQQDSLFTQHYNICQSLNSGNAQSGGMMDGGMMADGMMGSGMMGQMQMNYSTNGMNYQKAMDSLRQQHTAYCLRQ